MNNKPLASITKRSLATFIDYFIFHLIFLVYAMFFGQNTEEGYVLSGLMMLPLLGVWFCYFVVTEGLCQATLGHKLFDLKICQENFDRVDIRHAVKRRILDPIDLFVFGIPALIAANSSEKRQRLGDRYARTIVVVDVEAE